jgi:hypothetical protein
VYALHVSLHPSLHQYSRLHAHCCHHAASQQTHLSETLHLPADAACFLPFCLISGFDLPRLSRRLLQDEAADEAAMVGGPPMGAGDSLSLLLLNGARICIPVTAKDNKSIMNCVLL